MAEKFKNKYRIASTRAQWWDYGWNAAYFITICTAKREHFFGEIQNKKMVLSEIGELANEYWLEIPDHFPFVELDVHEVMPNHIHGIIVIDKPDDGRNNGSKGKQTGVAKAKTPNLGVSTLCPPDHAGQTENKHQTAAASQKWKPGTLGTILNQYKRICTIESRKIHPCFGWQTRFHDHIIRDNAEYQRIKNYIINNPKNWDDDKFFS